MGSAHTERSRSKVNEWSLLTVCIVRFGVYCGASRIEAVCLGG